MDFVKKNIKWITLGGLIIAFIGLFLPYATVSAEFMGTTIFSQSITYVEHDGIYVLLTLVACGVLYFLKKEKKSLMPLGGGALLTVYSAVNVGKVIGDNSYEGVKVGFGVGFYLLIVGLIVSLAAICYGEFVLKKQNSTVVVNANNIPQSNNQTYQPYGYNQSQRPIDSVYGQNMQNDAVNNLYNQPIVQSQSQNNVFNQPVEQVQNFNNPDVVICSQCRSTLKAGMSFCNQCGSKLN